MAKKRTTQNRTNKNTETPSARKARKEARDNGRGRNAAYTSGARSIDPTKENAAAMRERWDTSKKGYSRGAKGRFQKDNGNVDTYTRSKTGLLSTNGKTAGGKTWTMTPKNNDGTAVLNSKGEARQSGRSQMVSRSQKRYDVNKVEYVSPKAAEAMYEAGQISKAEYDNIMSGGNAGLSNGVT